MGKYLRRIISTVIWGPVVLLGIFFLSFILLGIFGLILYWDHPNVEWYGKDYYLQQQVCGVWEKEHNLFYQINGEKELLLPQVYGYKKDGSFVYIAAVQGYAVINLKDGTSDVIVRAKDIPQIKNPTISYHTSLLMLDESTQKILTSLPHRITAYFFDKDSNKTVGDGRFQCMYFYDEDSSGSYSLEAYKPYINSWYDTLLPHLNGYRMEKRTQIMYATSPHGYAIVDGPSGTCRVYFTDPELAEQDYQKDIYVLDSFEDFTPEEQELLRKVEEEGL
ncbi:MAG: hypothetical protein HFI72_00545 [Peptococcaceae bacterium]|nr:hypothetical protein [Peptococcaceae bacterium]